MRSGDAKSILTSLLEIGDIHLRPLHPAAYSIYPPLRPPHSGNIQKLKATHTKHTTVSVALSGRGDL